MDALPERESIVLAEDFKQKGQYMNTARSRLYAKPPEPKPPESALRGQVHKALTRFDSATSEQIEIMRHVTRILFVYHELGVCDSLRESVAAEVLTVVTEDQSRVQHVMKNSYFRKALGFK
ncbi:MAG: hypothetical protein JWM39_510 [Parcubacteria group bacterium]|nr:hypothetical protein [Parcubacteria group bacterium]